MDFQELFIGRDASGDRGLFAVKARLTALRRLINFLDTFTLNFDHNKYENFIVIRISLTRLYIIYKSFVGNAVIINCW